MSCSLRPIIGSGGPISNSVACPEAGLCTEARRDTAHAHGDGQLSQPAMCLKLPVSVGAATLVLPPVCSSQTYQHS